MKVRRNDGSNGKICNASDTSSYISSTGSNHPEVFLGKSVLTICSKFTGGHP